jgi:hypothetical protein
VKSCRQELSEKWDAEETEEGKMMCRREERIEEERE